MPKGHGSRPVKLTRLRVRVLAALMTEQGEALPGAEGRHGFEVVRRSGLNSSSVYLILDVLETAGLLVSRAEQGDPVALGRPLRRLFFLTDQGLRLARVPVRALARQARPVVQPLLFTRPGTRSGEESPH